MISLKEILHTTEAENKKNLIPYEEWAILETDYLSDIGFKPNGMYCMGLVNPPMLVYRKQNGYQLKDGKTKQTQVFPTFETLMEFFDNYQQDSTSK